MGRETNLYRYNTKNFKRLLRTAHITEIVVRERQKGQRFERRTYCVKNEDKKVSTFLAGMINGLQ